MPTEKERSAADPGLRQGAALAPLAGNFLCPHCGYNLRGLTRDRCPECGRPFERARLSESALPWLRRRWHGRFRAYWATVWLLTVHPGRLAAEFAHPVSYPDAQRFRWLTIFWAWLPLGFSSILFLASGDEDFLMLGSSRLATDVWLVSGFNLAAVFALIALTGVPRDSKNLSCRPSWLGITSMLSQRDCIFRPGFTRGKDGLWLRDCGKFFALAISTLAVAYRWIRTPSSSNMGWSRNGHG